MYKINKGPVRTILYLTIGTVASYMVSFVMMSLFMHQDFIKDMIDTMNSSFKMTNEMYAKMGVAKEQLDAMQKMLPTADFIKSILPVIILLASVVSGYVSYIIAATVFNKFGFKLEKMNSISNWYIPSGLFVGMFTFLLIGYIMNMKQLPFGRPILLNGLYLVFFAVGINGIAFVNYILKKREVNKGLRIAIIVFIMFTQLSFIILIAGLFDYIVNYREADKSKPALLKRN